METGRRDGRSRGYEPLPVDARVRGPGTAEALAGMLEGGDARAWRSLDLDTLCRLLPSLPLGGPAGALWRGYCAERVAALAGRKQVIDATARRILRIAASVLAPRGFELAGGAALAAVHLGHRRTRDLDFFAAGEGFGAAVDAFLAALAAAGLGPAVEARGPSFARLRAGSPPLPVELATHAPFRLCAPDAFLEGMPVHSLPDLAADKALALFGRAAGRDFVDLYVLMSRRYDLAELMELAARKDPRFDPLLFARALAQVVEADLAEVELLVPVDFGRVQETLLAAARRILRRELER
ncbi:MAG: nucleotidyl transferase AbiEii/AbiGii toxin family protein [Bacillota bacterium]|nr:nucleotidyl transferase AbiEii/AbiGii toxin family protein [Bacillota bacterium]